MHAIISTTLVVVCALVGSTLVGTATAGNAEELAEHVSRPAETHETGFGHDAAQLLRHLWQHVGKSKDKDTHAPDSPKSSNANPQLHRRHVLHDQHELARLTAAYNRQLAQVQAKTSRAAHKRALNKVWRLHMRIQKLTERLNATQSLNHTESVNNSNATNHSQPSIDTTHSSKKRPTESQLRKKIHELSTAHARLLEQHHTAEATELMGKIEFLTQHLNTIQAAPGFYSIDHNDTNDHTYPDNDIFPPLMFAGVSSPYMIPTVVPSHLNMSSHTIEIGKPFISYEHGQEEECVCFAEVNAADKFASIDIQIGMNQTNANNTNSRSLNAAHFNVTHSNSTHVNVVRYNGTISTNNTDSTNTTTNNTTFNNNATSHDNATSTHTTFNNTKSDNNATSHNNTTTHHVTSNYTIYEPVSNFFSNISAAIGSFINPHSPNVTSSATVPTSSVVFTKRMALEVTEITSEKTAESEQSESTHIPSHLIIE